MVMFSFKPFSVTLFTGVATIALSAAPMANASLDHTPSPFTEPVVEYSYDYLKLAQVGGDEIGGDDGNTGGGQRTGSDDDEGGTAISGGFANVSNTTTETILLLLREGQILCRGIPIHYRPDCLSEVFLDAARKLPPRGDYGEAHKALADASRKIKTVVRENRDGSQPRVRPRATIAGKTVRTPALTAVKPGAIPQVNREVTKIIEETETVLLRSARSDSKRAIHYQRIAAAVGSNKVLLRSSKLSDPQQKTIEV